MKNFYPHTVRAACRLLLLLCPIMGVRWASAAESPLRVAIMAFTPTESDPSAKPDGEAIADFLQSQLRAQPGVDWVERNALDRLLAEAELQPSTIALGRLVKADVLIHGVLGPLSGDHSTTAQAAGRKRLVTLEITDLTNASTLAAANIALEMRLAASGKLEPASLEPFAEQVRRLLSDALEEKRAAAKAVALAPVFFANAGASARLDGWEERILEGFASAASAFPQMRVLRFRGAAQASGEQSLALLGLTDADPSAWQTAAQGYLWGSYRELPASALTAFEDVQVEMEAFLWMGDQPPQRFVRQFAVKDFEAASGEMIREMMEQAARLGRPAPANHAEQIAALISEHLGEMIDAGFFTKDGKYRFSESSISSPAYESGTKIGEPIKRQPFGDKKLVYCTRALDLACFFDPQNARMQLLRALLIEERNSAVKDLPSDALLAPLAACVTQLQRIIQQPGGDMQLFAHGADCVFQRWGNLPLSLPWQNRPALPAKVLQQHERLMRDFRAFFLAQASEIFRRFDAAGFTRVGRQYALRWLASWLYGDAEPETKYRFFEAVWPQVGPYHANVQNVDAGLERLMNELGDRKRVQAVLMKYPFSQELIAKEELEFRAQLKVFLGGRTAASPAASPSPKPSSIPPRPTSPQAPGVAPGEPLLEGVRLVEGPFRPAIPPLPAKNVRTKAGEYWWVKSFSGFGDQLLLDATDTFNHGPHDYFSYQLSTHELKPVNASEGIDSLYTAHGRAIYRKGDAVGWTDLLSGESGDFLPENGLPVGAPSMLGLAGGRYAVVADRAKGAAGAFDWKTQKWISLPALPPAIETAYVARRPDQSESVRSRVEARPIVGTDEVIYFPGWRVLYQIDTQKWQEVPPLPLSRRKVLLTGNRMQLVVANVDRGELMLDGDLWQWNTNGISQYSLEKKSVVWQAAASDLLGVWPDGPYLWLAFGLPSEFKPDSIRTTLESFSNLSDLSALMLWDRSSHQPLGAAWFPGRVGSLDANDRELWLSGYTSMGNSPVMAHADKADLYAALGQKPPPPRRLARPQTFDAGNSALYDAVLREDTAAVQQLLPSQPSKVADLKLGFNAAPALAVAAWTGNADLVHLFLARGARLADALSAEPTQLDNFPLALNLDDKWTLLTAAARRSDPSMTRMLLGAGMPATAEAMRAATSYNHLEAALELAKAGAPLNNLLWWIDNKKDDVAARRLLDAKLTLTPTQKTQLEEAVAVKTQAPINPALANDLAALYKAIKQTLDAGNEDRTLELLRLAPAASINGPEAREAFRWAINKNCPKIVEAFLERGSDPNMTASERKEAVQAERSPKKNWFSLPGPPLVSALGHREITHVLLQHGADPMLDHDPKFTYLERVASRTGTKAEELTEVLQHYPKLNSKTGYGTVGGAALCAAVARWTDRPELRPDEHSTDMTSCTEALRLLIEHGAPPGARNREGYAALHFAFALRNPTAACLLAGDGADLEAQDLAGRTIFDPPYTPYDKGRGSFYVSLQKYAPRSEVESQGQKRLLAALQSRPTYEELRDAVLRNDIPRAENLLRRGALTDIPTNDVIGNPFPRTDTAGLLFTAANNRAHQMAALLLRCGANPNIGESGAMQKDSHNTLPSIVFGPMKQVRIAQLTAARNPGKTALIAAAESGDASLARMLLDHGADPTRQDQFHRTAADAAATPELARSLAEGARAYQQSASLAKALSDRWVAGFNPVKTLEQILQSAPEVLTTRNEWNSTYLAEATRLERDMFGAISLEVSAQKLALLPQHGFPLDTLDEYGLSPLHWAVLYDLPELAAGLVKIGFNPTLTDTRGITALDLAGAISDETDRSEMLAALKADAAK